MRIGDKVIDNLEGDVGVFVRNGFKDKEAGKRGKREVIWTVQ